MNMAYLTPSKPFASQQLLIDDDFDFLRLCGLHLADAFNPKLFDSPLEALEYLEKSSSIREVFEGEWIIPKPKISVAIVDYAMPEINGIEVCRRIADINPFVKKIMLTGEADLATAVAALNQEEIDYFIPKSTPDLMNEINRVLSDVEDRYFAEIGVKLAKSSDMTTARLIAETRAALVDDGESIDELVGRLPEMLRFFLDLILQDFDYEQHRGSSTAAAARGLAALSARLDPPATKHS